ncbi:hypothetical protein OJF2_69130 [Aquisphaera giovannonii]|uniref:Uncharacterized protein n=1 Tax=Aquisphaera giovannonii TaxID=406548 RepID=A0A5B9WCL3_9BACT|nr:hypothetical protein [Aquisphaera giovannonii]QEH38312.1 hypothetical protein OJF2_69130 [Aquisphaera giovannonii]
MAKYVHALLRVVVLFGGATTLLALLISMGRAGGPEARPSWMGRWESVFDPRWGSSASQEERIFLVDRESGDVRPMALPGGERWEYVGISPWSVGGDEFEAVGRYYRVDSRGGGCGLGRIRLPEGEVMERFDLDVLPTSRPCWVPGRPGRILFTAGDGRLYRYDLAVGHRAPEGGRSTPRPLEWRCPPPPKVPCFLTDPALCTDPRFRDLAVVTLISQARGPGREIVQSTSLWWLRLDDDATAVEACGPIVEEPALDGGGARPLRRFPTLAAGRDGAPELVYLVKDERSPAMQMVLLPLEVDDRAGGLRMRPGAGPTTVSRGCAAVPPVVGAGGRTAYGFAPDGGLPIRRPI